MLRSFDPGGQRDLVFIPVGINYDRTLEDRSFLLELDPSREKSGGALANTGRFVAKNASLMARNKWHRFGYACVNFGSPVSARAYLTTRSIDLRGLPKEERFARVEEFARELMAAVAKVIPVVPVSAVATLFVREPERAWSELEIKSEVLRLFESLQARGAHVYVPRGDQDYAIAVGLRMLTLRRLVEENKGLFLAVPSEVPLLSYYASSIAHFFPAV